MKINSLKFGATIPTQSYGNIQPEIEMSEVGLEEGTKIGLDFISDLFSKYSEKGGLIPKEIIKNTGTKKSFNEGVDILFEPLAHTYYFGDKKLIGANEYIERFYKPFDSETISDVSAKAWGVDQQDVKDLWDANGKLTSAFGTIVHKALEHYFEFKELGSKISKKKGIDENYAMPKHPIIQSIINGFLAIDTHKGETESEKLLSDVKLGVCGTTDRIDILDRKNKICRITDYKINVNCEDVDKSHKVLAPFDKLPANKLSKYQLQLSIYANLLQRSGWKVEGLDIYVLEKEWKHYTLPVLQII